MLLFYPHYSGMTVPNEPLVHSGTQTLQHGSLGNPPFSSMIDDDQLPFWINLDLLEHPPFIDDTPIGLPIFLDISRYF